jgi:hypothetical protein
MCEICEAGSISAGPGMANNGLSETQNGFFIVAGFRRKGVRQLWTKTGNPFVIECVKL